MSVYSTSFLEIYARHAVPVVPWAQQAQTHRAESEGRTRSMTFVIPSPMAPPYQVYPARDGRGDERHAA